MAITERTSTPCILDLQALGIIEGVTYSDSKTRSTLCHFVGGLPYALPPLGPFRFQKPRPLPRCYRYGTMANPGRFVGGCGLCPQLDPIEDSEPFWDEDCLQTNIWIPAGTPPSTGWPVLVWYHGGFLQFGGPGDDDLTAMLGETTCKVIVVMPAYRLNVFGFLASPEVQEATEHFSANAGFWDQRLALEWTWKNISYFDGDASNITIGGYSAGSHSTFHQLAYDLGLPDSQAIVRRALMMSNGPGMQPKSQSEVQAQFDELTAALKIPSSMTPAEKLATLRALDPKTLLEATKSMKYHQFRGVTDDSFIRSDLLAELDSGLFAARMKRRSIKLLMGECRDEHFVYQIWHTPQNSYDSVFQRLEADYSLPAVKALMKHYFPNQKLPSNGKYKDWKDAFGHIYADMQIHHLERGMAHALASHGAAHLLYRYRIEWRSQSSLRGTFPPKEWGVTHGTDLAIWFWGDGGRLSFEDMEVVGRSFHTRFASFLYGGEVEWGNGRDGGGMELRTLKPDGKVFVEEDRWMEEGLKVWDILKGLGKAGDQGHGLHGSLEGSKL